MIILQVTNKINAKHCISSILQGIAYHQKIILYIIKPTVMHTSCDDIRLTAMIYMLMRDDIPSLSAWIKN